MLPVILIAYSGHALVIHDILTASGRIVTGYCEPSPKTNMANPYNIPYFGDERQPKILTELQTYDYFIAIGENPLRRRVFNHLKALLHPPINAIHPSAIYSPSVQMGNGIMIAPNVTINALAKIGHGVICNTACIIEHECIIGDFVHIAPGAVLAGDVKVGANTFIGANAVIKQGIRIGSNAIIGAGTVVIRDVPDGVIVVGNPQRQLKE